jgi:hypothetical protein
MREASGADRKKTRSKEDAEQKKKDAGTRGTKRQRRQSLPLACGVFSFFSASPCPRVSVSSLSGPEFVISALTNARGRPMIPAVAAPIETPKTERRGFLSSHLNWRMTMNGNRHGASIVAIVVGLVVLAGVAFGGLYMFSDVFRTKADSAIEGFSKWTPENIAKDPVNYLNFCEKQTNAAVDKLKASEIAIAQKKAKLETMEKDAQDKLTLGKKALGELRVAYTEANAANSFPVSWRGATLDKDQCKRQIIRTAGEIKSKEDLAKMYNDAGRQLQVQSEKIVEARDEAGKQLAKIATNREMLKVQSITDDLKNQLVAMKGVLETSVVAVSSSNTGGSISLDDLAAKSATTVDDSKFDEIMKQK